MRKNKRILVGVTGGIAAYKSPDLVRRLIERGADVRVAMTESAREFITPLTLQAVSGHPVHLHLLDAEAESGMGHIELARWAEMIIVAPATANFIAGIAHGKADDLLSAVISASRAELIIAPAMNRQMWLSRANQENIRILDERKVGRIGPGEGDQACGDVGPGRMSEPDFIARQVLGDGIPRLLPDRSVLITAGPTWEAIDPVRGITNHSSGKMGFALAQAALDFGADVTMVCGPVHLETPGGAARHDVVSAEEMRRAVMNNVRGKDIFIGTAAVADYRPAETAGQKLKKNSDEMVISLVRNPDILAEVAALENKPFTVGFAAETRDIVKNGRKKLTAKNADMIVANNVAGAEGAFANDSNAATLLYRDGKSVLPRTDKYRLAVQIIEKITDLMKI